MKVWVSAVALIVLLFSVDAQDLCTQDSQFKDVCNQGVTCNTTEGIIDLSPMKSLSKMHVTALGAAFDYHPVKTFSEKGCASVLMCEKSVLTRGSPVAYPGYVKFSQCGRGYVLRYKSYAIKKTADVYLTCKNSTKAHLYYMGMRPANHYMFELQSKYACPQSAPPTSTPKTSPSTKTTKPTKPHTKPTKPTKPNTKPSTTHTKPTKPHTKPTTKPTHPPTTNKSTPKSTPAKHITTKKSTPAKTTPKTTPAKTTPAKTTPKSTPRKTTPKKTTPAKTTHKTTPPKTTPAKTSPKKTTPRKTTPAKTSPKTTPRKTTPIKTTPQKTSPKKVKTTAGKTTPVKPTPGKSTTPATPKTTPSSASSLWSTTYLLTGCSLFLLGRFL